jgi:hypothetical protein
MAPCGPIVSEDVEINVVLEEELIDAAADGLVPEQLGNESVLNLRRIEINLDNDNVILLCLSEQVVPRVAPAVRIYR